MYLLNPESVVFGGVVLEDVQSVVVNRAAEKSVVEWSDDGPYVVFADVPQQRVGVRIVRRLSREQVTELRPGDEGELRVTVTPSGARSDAGRRVIVATCVVMSVVHELGGATAAGGARNAVQTIVLEAVSGGGGVDPVGEE